jgi:hypothetical protein
MKWLFCKLCFSEFLESSKKADSGAEKVDRWGFTGGSAEHLGCRNPG